MRRGSAFTFLEMLVTTAVVGMLVVVVLPTLSRSRELTLRNCCASNLYLAARGLIQYADDNDGMLPTCRFGPGTVRYDTVGRYIKQRRRVAHSNSRNLFLAVRTGHLTPGMLLCPETADQPASLGEMDAPYYDFNVGFGRGYVNRLSYSYHLQFIDRDTDTPGYPISLGSPSGMAVLADRNPCLSYPGLSYRGGVRAAWIELPGGLPARQANSRNHSRRGQNVAFVGGEVRWTTSPAVGVDGDNIYTVWAGADRADGVITKSSMPRGPTDSFLVP